jgi:hypothetical protein
MRISHFLSISTNILSLTVAFPVIALTEAELTECMFTYPRTMLSKAMPTVPVMRSEDVPWSTLAITEDSFDGKQTAIIMDKNDYYREASPRVVTKTIYTFLGTKLAAFEQHTSRRGRYTSDYKFNGEVVSAKLKIDGTIFDLQKSEDLKGGFTLSDNVIQAMIDAKEIIVRLELLHDIDDNTTVTFPLGKKTISEWNKRRELMRPVCTKPLTGDN